MKIALIAHGDYSDEGGTYLLKKCNINAFWWTGLGSVGATNGYDGDKAYEYVLHEARTGLAWSPICVRRALVMIGDSNQHTTSNNKIGENRLMKLAKMDVRIHTVQALGYGFSSGSTKKWPALLADTIWN